MKKVLLTSFIFLITALSVYAYETVIIKFPQDEVWHKSFYKKIGLETILQYVPRGETYDNWDRAIIVHSYNQSSYTVPIFMANNLILMSKKNPTGKYEYLKYSEYDSIAGRCTKDYKGIKGQCEFYRVTRAHQGIITIHYINRNEEDFKNNFALWYDVIKRAKYLNTYYRNERTLNKSEYFELW